MADSIEGVDELNNSIAELNRTLSYFSSSMGTASRTVGESTTRFDRSMSESSRLSQIRDENDQAREKRKIERDNNLNNAMNATASSLRSFGAAAVSAEQGFKKYGDSISRAGEAISDVAKNFGILGNVFGGAVRLITAFSSVALGSVDVLVNFRDEVSKTSGAIPTTLRGMQALGMQAGYSGDRLQVLQKITIGLGTGLQALGGVAGTGVIKFAQLANVSEDVRRRFGYMGVDQERLTELQAKYVQMQAASGMQYQLQNKSMTQLRKESLDYADNMTKLSALTGKEVDTLQKEQEQVQLEFEEQAAMLADRTRINQLRAEGRDEEANQLQRELDARKKVQGTLTNLLGPELASQMSRVFRTGFFDTKSGPLSQIMPELVGYSEKLKNIKPGEDADAITRDIFNTVKKKYEEGAITFETVLQVMGEEGAKSLGYSAETIKRLLSYEDKNYEQIMADADRNKKEAEKAGKTAEDVADLREAEIKLQADFQKALVPLAEQLMPMITSTMNLLHENFEGTVKPLLDRLGIGLGWVNDKITAWIADGSIEKLATGIGEVSDSMGKWLDEGNLTKLINGLSETGKALAWLSNNIVGVGVGLGVLAGTLMAFKRKGGGGGGGLLEMGGLLGKGSGTAPDRGGKMAGMLGKSARLLGKFALPVTAVMAAGDAFAGTNADPTASLGNKLKNAGSSALSGVSLGLLGSSPAEIAEKAAAEKLNRENIVTHTSTVITDTKQRRENIDQNAKLAKETKEQMTEETRMFGLLTKAMKETTSIFLPFKQSIEGITELINGGGSEGSPGDPGGASDVDIATAKGDWKKDPEFLKEVARVSSKFGFSQGALLSVMQSESGISPTAYNKNGGASGLIQFMPKTARGLGTTTAEIRRMSRAQQMKYVEAYLAPYARDLKGASAGKLYSYVFLPGRANRKSGVLTDESEIFYAHNKGLDTNKDGRIDIADLDRRLAKTAKQAKLGGIFSGPTSGYPVEMHGTEMVAPLNVNSILMKLAQTPVGSADTGTALNSVIQPGSNSSIDIEKIVSAQYNMIQLLSNKLDNMVDALESSNSTQSKILRYTMV